MSFGLDGSDAGRLELPFRTIALERTECEGKCPIDRVEFHSDGTATYVGEAFVERTGTFSGEVYLRSFGQLSLMVERVGVMEMDDRYDAPMTDQPTVIITITPKKGSAKRIEDNGGFGPPELWGVEHAILGLMEQISWIPDAGVDPG
ncbi:MAG: hypothetical protein KC470_07680 [Dehalococcoidia bacterium]|nr:hypothetical protein [Dehalococcoidia bacterium]